MRKSATRLAASPDPNIPICTAETFTSRLSSSTLSVSACGSTAATLRTPVVDWIVRAVIPATPYHPWAAIVFMSAFTPAPDDGSNPAIVRGMGGVSGMIGIYRKTRLEQNQAACQNRELARTRIHV